MDSFLSWDRFAMDAEVCNIGNTDMILVLSWWMENGFSVNTQDRCLKNVISGQVIPCSARWIPEVLIIEEEPLEDGGIQLIIDTREWYFCYAEYIIVEQVAKLPKPKSWDQQIPLQNPTTKIPTGAIYKTKWKEDQGLHKSLQENIPTKKFPQSRSSTAVLILFVYKKDESLRLFVNHKALN